MSFLTSICIFALSVASVVTTMRVTALERKVRKLEREKWLREQDDRMKRVQEHWMRFEEPPD